MKLIALTTALAVMASQATALSCMRPDIRQAYEWADQSAETYIVLFGQIEYDEGAQTLTPDDTNQRDQQIQYQGIFKGVQMGRNGNTAPFERAITVENICLGPWCGYVDGSPETISFVQQLADGSLKIQGSPCPFKQFSSPEPDVLQHLMSCMRGQDC